MDDGDCDAAIPAADAASVIHVQSLSQEVGSRDEGRGLYGFGLSSAYSDPSWLEGAGKIQVDPMGLTPPSLHDIDLGTMSAEAAGAVDCARLA